MDLKVTGLIGGLVFLLGIGVGSAFLGGKYIDGRLSACKDMTKVLNQGLPLQMECSLRQSDVCVTSPLFNGKYFTLDGQDCK